MQNWKVFKFHWKPLVTPDLITRNTKPPRKTTRNWMKYQPRNHQERHIKDISGRSAYTSVKQWIESIKTAPEEMITWTCPLVVIRAYDLMHICELYSNLKVQIMHLLLSSTGSKIIWSKAACAIKASRLFKRQNILKVRRSLQDNMAKEDHS